MAEAASAVEAALAGQATPPNGKARRRDCPRYSREWATGWPSGSSPPPAARSCCSRWPRRAGNNRAVSTAMASSFLNAGTAGGWSAWPERVVGVAGPLADLATPYRSACQASQARASCGVEEAGSRRRAQKAPNSRSGSASRRAAFGPRVGQHRGGVQALDPPGPCELVHRGDAVDDRPHPCEAGGQDGPVRPVGGRAQADRWRVAVSVQGSRHHPTQKQRLRSRPGNGDRPEARVGSSGAVFPECKVAARAGYLALSAAGARWRVRYTVARETVNSSARSAIV